MKELVSALSENYNLLSEGTIANRLLNLKSAAAQVIAQCILSGIPIPCMSEAINFFNSVTTAHSTANLIQAQRDYFGAHTYQRTNDPTEKFHHTIWKNQ